LVHSLPKKFDVHSGGQENTCLYETQSFSSLSTCQYSLKPSLHIYTLPCTKYCKVIYKSLYEDGQKRPKHVVHKNRQVYRSESCDETDKKYVEWLTNTAGLRYQNV
jgi:hypothetical protein